MQFKIKHIFDGIKNSIFVKEEVEKIALERYEICSTCPKNSKNKDMNDPMFVIVDDNEENRIIAREHNLIISEIKKLRLSFGQRFKNKKFAKQSESYSRC